MTEEFDPLDLNEDGEVSPLEELIGLVTELETLQADDFNFWREVRLQKMRDLITEGVEGDEHVYLAEPEPTPATEFDESGFSTGGIFVQQKDQIEMANSWAESNDRLLEYGAHLVYQNWYMLPVDRLQDDSEFQARYLKNLTTAAKGPKVTSRSGYKNRPVFETFIAKPRGPHTDYVGQGVITDHYFPFAGQSHADIVQIFLDDISSGAFRERMLRVAHNALAEMDRGNKEKWEGYREVPSVFIWDRNAELEHARNNPNY